MQPRVIAAMLAAALLLVACGSEALTPGPGTPAPTPSAPAGSPTEAPSDAATDAPSGLQPSGGPSGGPSASAEAATLVGIALPGAGSERWAAEGALLASAIAELGYTVVVEHADDAAAQAQQLDRMLDDGADALVIAAVDPLGLGDVLERAGDAGVGVLAYDRLIRDTPEVDYYVAFDRFGVGELLGTSLEQSLDMKGGSGPRTVELLAGDPDDRDEEAIVAGVRSVLQPYLDTGALIVPSGRIQFPEVATRPADEATARATLAERLEAGRRRDRLDAVVSTADALSRGAIAALVDAGYFTPDRAGPVVTGVGAELPSVRSILAGEQTSTVFQDPRVLARQAATMVDQLLRGLEVEVNDAGTIDNGAGIVPAFLQDSVLVTADNLEAELVETGYYTEAEVHP